MISKYWREIHYLRVNMASTAWCIYINKQYRLQLYEKWLISYKVFKKSKKKYINTKNRLHNNVLLQGNDRNMVYVRSGGRLRTKLLILLKYNWLKVYLVNVVNRIFRLHLSAIFRHVDWAESKVLSWRMKNNESNTTRSLLFYKSSVSCRVSSQCACVSHCIYWIYLNYFS